MSNIVANLATPAATLVIGLIAGYLLTRLVDIVRAVWAMVMNERGPLDDLVPPSWDDRSGDRA